MVRRSITRLRHLDEICVKAELIKASRGEGFPEFSGDGEYLVHHTVHDLVAKLGTSDDDSQNTFTARMLLLLESRPLVGEEVYRQALDDVIAPYWGDYEDHAEDFVPSFLANDILRMWRTFCVNYEARTKRDPPVKKAKRKLKNYKLKHSRLLTCYFALAYLLDVHRANGTVSPADARTMASLTPTERLEQLASAQPANAGPLVDVLIRKYERFLENTDAPTDELVQRFMDSEHSSTLLHEAKEFGNAMFDLLRAVGDDPLVSARERAQEAFRHELVPCLVGRDSANPDCFALREERFEGSTVPIIPM
jgi:hypothetical protein